MRKMTYERYKKRRKRRRRVRAFVKTLALFVICLTPFFVLTEAAARENPADIRMSVKSCSIMQGEKVPDFEIELETEEKGEMILDRKSGYTLQDFLNELKQDTSYQIQCDADGTTEGEYPVSLTLSSQMTEKIHTEYLNRMRVEVKSGKLTVKNPVGEWDGDRFRRYDGTYVTNEFVDSKGDTYYFDAEGKKVSGWQLIAEKKYYFNEKGILMKNCWQENGESRCYLGETGSAVTGWLTLEDKKYYFDKEGFMVTGAVLMDSVIYSFGEDGSLISERSTKVDPGKPMVALTFDDGPGKRTGELLAQLEKYYAHATFFMVGKNVPSYPEEVKKMKELGCELGNHSYNHANLGKSDAGTIREQIGSTNNNISALVGQTATVMRPPYGSVSGLLKENAGMPLILWNIDTLDWKTRNAQATIDSVMSQVKDGDIILMHDIHTESIDAAIELIPKLQEAGYQLVTVSEMAAAKGVQMQNGGVYTDF